MLERDEHYDVIPENAEGAAFVPPTPQEMKAQIDAARVVTKEMKKQAKRDAKMAAKISSRALVNLGEIVELAFDAKHIHLFDGYTEATMLERDEHYDVIPENAEGAAFVPPTPQEMKAQIDAARVITKWLPRSRRKTVRRLKRLP